jgi:uncharacterized protein (DUF1778 family)
MANLQRSILQNFRVSESERDLIKQKMSAAGINNKEHYFRKMVLDGYILRLDLADIRDMTNLLSNATNNLNQIAKGVNADGSIFASDIKDIQENYDRLWEQTNKILKSLANIRK